MLKSSWRCVPMLVNCRLRTHTICSQAVGPTVEEQQIGQNEPASASVYGTLSLLYGAKTGCPGVSLARIVFVCVSSTKGTSFHAPTRFHSHVTLHFRLLDQEQVRKMIVACGGRFQDDLDVETTTHLIATTVGSQKHRVRMHDVRETSSNSSQVQHVDRPFCPLFVCLQTAEAYELVVVSPCWVFESFRAQKLLDVHDFGLRLLEGIGVCTSGLTVEEKETVERVATAHGAQYDGRLELGFTSVLIAQVREKE